MTKYSFDDGSTWQTSNSKAFSSNQTVNIKVKDAAGNVSAKTTVTISKIDKTKPTISSVDGNPSAWTNQNVTLTVNATDAASGVTKYSFDDGSTWQTSNSKAFSGNQTVNIKVKDAAGNVSAKTTVTISKIDKTNPTITTVDGNPSAWTNQNVTLTVTATDPASGVAYYSFDNGSTWQTANTKSYSSNQTVNIKVKDDVGNISTATTVTINKIDKTKPTISSVTGNPTSWINQNVTLTVTATDAASGVAYYSFDNGSTWQAANTKSYSSNQTVNIKVKDDVGNISDATTVTINKIDKTKPTISSVDGNPSAWTNQNVTLTVTATDPASGVAYYSFDSGSTWQTSNSMSFSSNQTVNVKVKDSVGNISDATTITIEYIDTTAPVVPYGFVSGDILEICQFDSGNSLSDEHFEYRIGNNENWETYFYPVRIVCTEDTVIYIKAVDAAHNETLGTSVVMKANVGIYTSTKDDLRNGDFMLPSGFIRTYDGNTKDWFFAFKANIQSECNGKALKYTDFYGNETYYVNDADNTTKYYSVQAAEITAENNTVQISDTVSVPYAYKLKSEKGDVYFNAAGKICAVIDGNQKVIYNWSSTSLVISDTHNRTYTVNFINENPVSITDCANHTATFAWADGKLTSAANALNYTETYTYDANGRLTQNGSETVNYTADGRTAQITQQNGSFLKYTYNDTYTENNKVGRVQISDGRGVSVFCFYEDRFAVGETPSVYGEGAVYAGSPAGVVFQNADLSGFCMVAGTVKKATPITVSGIQVIPLGNTYYYMQYDANGDMTGLLTAEFTDAQLEDETFVVPENYTDALTYANEKIENTYTGRLLTESITYVKVEGQWGYKSKVTYTYADGLLTNYNRYKIVSGEWAPEYAETYAYDAFGNLCETLTADDSVSSTAYTTIQKTYDSLNRITAESYYTGTELDYTNTYTYDALGRSVSVSYNGDIVSYTYNADGNINSYTYNNETASFNYVNGNLLSYTDTEGITKTYTYDAYGNAVGVSFDIYSLEYNSLGSLTKANVNNTELVSFAYAGVMQDIASETYANGQTVTYTYNNDGNVTSVSLNNTPVYTYAFSTQNDTDVITVTDLAGNLTKTITDGLTTVSANGNTLYSVENHYGTSEENDFYGTVYTLGGNTYTLVSENEKDTFKTGNAAVFEKEYLYDNDHNLTQIKIENILTADLGYNADGAITSYQNTLAAVTQTYTYLYNTDGNITSETKTVSQDNAINSESITYSYENNQLTSAETASTKWTYSYDNRGNILEKNTYALSNGTQTLVAADTFSYDNTVWQDELTAFNNQSIAYDAAGNPTSYLGHSLTWTMGRQLASFDGISYTYNEDGIRTSKTANNVTTRYYLDGTNVIAQTDGTNTLYFRYDSNGSLTSVIFNGTEYFYLKNGLGDITGLADANGNIVAEYAYDPWGVVISVTGSNIALANANPFRYRGYYYDTDTEMYYLQSRYYDPEICRFINADDANYITIIDTLFNYCYNNPILFTDYFGKLASTGTLGQLQDLVGFLQSLGGYFAAIAAILLLLITFLSIIQSLSNTTVLTDTQVGTNPKDKDVILYRYGATKTTNLWPRMNMDYDGLSFSSVPPSKPNHYPYVMTTVQKLETTNMFFVVRSEKKPTHYLIIPIDGNVEKWMKEGQKSIYTKILSLAVTEVFR